MNESPPKNILECFMLATERCATAPKHVHAMMDLDRWRSMARATNVSPSMIEFSAREGRAVFEFDGAFNSASNSVMHITISSKNEPVFALVAVEESQLPCTGQEM
jgi:hypothetical protein